MKLPSNTVNVEIPFCGITVVCVCDKSKYTLEFMTEPTSVIAREVGSEGHILAREVAYFATDLYVLKDPSDKTSREPIEDNNGVINANVDGFSRLPSDLLEAIEAGILVELGVNPTTSNGSVTQDSPLQESPLEKQDTTVLHTD